MSAGQQKDQLAIGRRERELVQARTVHPPHFLAQRGAWCRGQCAAVEVERHRAIGIRVSRRQQPFVDEYAGIELLVNLAMQRNLV